MKTKILLTTLATAGLLAGLASPASAITAAETEALLFMKQEEKLARDFYLAMHEKWGHPVFQNIAAAEQRHMEAVDRLIAYYRLTDATPAAPGEFSIPELQIFYDDLLTAGSRSLPEALAGGVMVEEADIADLRAALAVTSETPIRRVLANLLNASESHLSAFTRVIGQVKISPGRRSGKGSSPGICGEVPQ